MIDWQQRFRNQLKWTRELRDYLYNKINLHTKVNLLEIGCGHGELLKEIGENYDLDLYGIEIDAERITAAEQTLQGRKIKANLIHKDFLRNNFDDQMFEVIVTNYVFLWIQDLKKAFKEIHRILKKNGILLIFSEPDYGGFIEYPNTNFKNALISNLIKLGADPEVGRKLNQYFDRYFAVIEKFCTSSPWIANTNELDLLNEVEFFKKLLKDEDWDSKMMKFCIERKNYFIFIPTFSYYLRKV